MDELELKSLIDSKIKSGIGGNDGELSLAREDNLDRYNGGLYGYEVDGESTVVTRDLMETIEWAMPSIMRVFANGRQVVQFKPVNGADEQAAEQETDTVWEIYDENAGFYITHTLIKSALLNPNSYVKIFREEKTETVKESYQNLTEWELSAVLESNDIEIVGQEVKYTDEGQPLFDIDIEYEVEGGETRIIPLPEEEVIVEKNHNELSLKNCHFTCHHTEKTRSDLVTMGYDEKQLDLVGSDSGEYSSETQNRRWYSDENNSYNNEADESMRTYWVEECNMFVDFNNDGVAERRRVVKIGNEIFENEEIDTADIVSFSSLLMPHKHIGMCLADLVKDLQEIRTVLMRQLLNNLYKVNNPRTVITDDVNMDDILSNESNGYIRTDDINGLRTEPTTPIIAQVIPAFELLNNEKESRTGVSKNAKGLDAEVLKNSTMGAYRDAISQANERIELIIRVLAETGFKELFCKIHEVESKHGQAREIQVNGQWVQVNPREWKERKHMRAKVGLGFNNQEQKMGAAQVIAMRQDKIIEQGGMGTLLKPENVYHANELIAEAAGEHVDRFFTNPLTNPPPPQPQPQPDPNILMIQANKEIEGGKLQVQQMKNQADVQLKTQDQQLKERELMIKERELFIKEAELGINQQDKQNDLAKAQIDSETKITIASMDNEAEITKASIEASRPQPEPVEREEKEPVVININEAAVPTKKKVVVRDTPNGMVGEIVGE